MKNKLASALNLPKGYTLVELMIVISIVAIMLSLGASAYGKARDRQTGQAAGELLVSILQENQKKALIGNKDCTGVFAGQRVTTSTPNIVTSVSTCEGGVEGEPDEIEIPNVTSITATTIVFNPLTRGTTISSNPLYIDLVVSGLTTYRVQLNRAGIIQYRGLQP